MNDAKMHKGQKILAMAIVAMFAMCAFSVCLAADSDAGPYGGVSDETTDKQNQVYKVEISVGQTFTYTGITTNLSSYGGASVTITGAWVTAPASSSDYEGFSYTQNATTFTGSFNKAGEYTYKFTATSTHTTNGEPLTQTATQTLNFIVKDKIELPTSASGYAIVDETQIGDTLITIPYKGPAQTEGITTTTLKEGDAESTNFQYVYDGSNILIKAKNTFSATGTYSPTLTVTNNLSKDTDSTAITITVFEDIAVSNAGTHLYTYEGKDLEDFTFTVSYDTDGKDKTEVNTHVLAIGTPTGSSSNAVGTNPLTITGADSYTVNIDTSNKTSGHNTGDNLSADFTATLTVTGIIRGETQAEGVSTPDKITGEATGTVTVTVYKALEFASAPTTENIQVTALTSTGNAINFSAYIKGAKSVIFNWGDGTQTSSMDNCGNVANTYGAYHNYAKAGLYTVTVYAINDHGTTTSQVMYKAGYSSNDGAPENTENTDSEKKSFIDEHGYQFIIFAILTILLLVAFFYFGFQNPAVVLLAIVFAALSVCCYVYNDIGGIIDAVKELLK